MSGWRGEHFPYEFEFLHVPTVLFYYLSHLLHSLFVVGRGIVPAMGHDLVATETEILGAMSASPDRQLHITHLFNVCSFHHRSGHVTHKHACTCTQVLCPYMPSSVIVFFAPYIGSLESATLECVKSCHGYRNTPG